jgi:hypothetical protein
MWCAGGLTLVVPFGGLAREVWPERAAVGSFRALYGAK